MCFKLAEPIDHKHSEVRIHVYKGRVVIRPCSTSAVRVLHDKLPSSVCDIVWEFVIKHSSCFNKCNSTVPLQAIKIKMTPGNARCPLAK